jgi:hypothetical protein
LSLQEWDRRLHEVNISKRSVFFVSLREEVMSNIIGNLSENNLDEFQTKRMYYLNFSSLDCMVVVVYRTNQNYLYSDLNRLIMDYLVVEGYKSAAEEFGQEAELSSTVDFQSIESRMVIREALQRGDVENAIMKMNDFNPEVCVWHPCLFCCLSMAHSYD